MDLVNWYWHDGDGVSRGPVAISAIAKSFVKGGGSKSFRIRHGTYTNGVWVPASKIEPLRIILREQAHHNAELILPANLVAPDPSFITKPSRPLGQHELPISERAKLSGPLLLESDFVDVAENGQIDVRIRNIKEAKLAVKALKNLKKKLSLEVRQLNSEMKAIRSAYTASVRQRGPMIRVGGVVGKVIRSVDSVSRSLERVQLAKSLEPHEQKKQRIEALVHRVDTVILTIESAS